MTSRPAADPVEAPRFARKSDGRMIAGIAGALADQFGIQPIAVRLAFCLMSALSGFGLVLYLALWVFTPTAARVVGVEDTALPAGIAAASRTGKRERRRLLSSRSGDVGQLAALAAIALGVLLAVQNTPIGLQPELFVPLVLVAGGLVLVWRTADEQDRRRLAQLSPRAPWLGAIVGGQKTAFVARL